MSMRGEFTRRQLLTAKHGFMSHRETAPQDIGLEYRYENKDFITLTGKAIHSKDVSAMLQMRHDVMISWMTAQYTRELTKRQSNGISCVDPISRKPDTTDYC